MKSIKVLSDSLFKIIAKKILLAYLVFLGIATTMLVFVKCFHMETLIPHPQFGLNKEIFEVLFPVASENFSYHSFFWVDMLFMASILILVLYIFKYIKTTCDTFEYVNLIKYALLIVGSISILFDFIENIIYLGWIRYPKDFDLGWIEMAKIISIALFFLVFIYFLLLNVLLPMWGKIIGFVRSSFISILILAVIGLGLTFMAQGATLVVHLLDEAKGFNMINLILCLFLVNTLALIISHFPIYFEFLLNKKAGEVKWNMNHIFGGFGIITYVYKGEKDTWKKFARHSLGVLTYSTWFYVIYKAFDIYQLSLLDSTAATVLFTIAILGIFAYLYNQTNYLKIDIKKDVNTKAFMDALIKYKNWSKYFLYLLCITLIYGLIWLTIIHIYEIGWSRTNLILSIIFTVLNVFTYILFRITKSMWIYAWGNTETIQALETFDHKNISYIDAKAHQLISSSNKKLSFFDPRQFLLRLYSNNKYVNTVRWLGIISLFILVLSNFLLNQGQVTMINAIVILLAFIINFYALITISIKHFLFYKNEKNGTIWKQLHLYNKVKSEIIKKRFLPIVVAILLLFVIISSLTKSADNIHQLDFEPYKNRISLTQFGQKFDQHIDSLNIQKLANIASFGGGLKSNLWTLLTMNQLSSSFSKKNQSNGDSVFLDRCISISGVSGGALGVGNYLALDYLYRDKKQVLEDKIFEIGLANIVSIDMAGIFVHDWFLNHISHWLEPREDRAHYAMQEYINIIAKDKNERNQFNKSMRHVWSNMHDKHHHVPALIINSASTGPKPGVAFSVHSNDAIFPSYIDLSEPKKSMDLSYYNAISTSNRFPIMSPAAQVDQKGFFLDGGYFENSGLLSSGYFTKALEISSNHMKNLPRMTINIINSKSSYIRKFIKDHEIKLDVLNSSTNINAIVNGLADIEKLPEVLREAELSYGEKGDTIFSIYLPHWITINDIKNTVGGTIEISPTLLGAIKSQNGLIKDALSKSKGYLKRYGVVEPPLARTLSRPAVEYQKAMIKYHKDCKHEIKQIIDQL